MKIQRFNESLENIKECVTLMIIDENGTLRSGAFETKTDMDNWLLNLINEEVANYYSPALKNSGVVYNEGEEPIFIDVDKAINWYQEYLDCDIYYDEESSFIKNEKVKYGVELARTTNKYNI